MKSILLSVKPEWTAKILNGEKTLEIRKTAPKCDLPIDVYIYCTKDKNLDWYYDSRFEAYKKHIRDHELVYEYFTGLKPFNGKVVAKFTLRKVDKILVVPFGELAGWEEELLAKSCLSLTELDRYLKEDYGYAWHIDDLQIFDKPMELSDFCKPLEEPKHLKIKNFKQAYAYALGSFCEKHRGEFKTVEEIRNAFKDYISIKKPPQSWMHVEEPEWR